MIVPLALAGANPLTATNSYEISPIKTEPTVVFDSKEKIIEYIKSAAEKERIDPYIPLYIAEHESSFNPEAVGDGHLTCLLKGSPNYGKPIRSRGIFQINDCAHPSISDEEAFNVVSSTAWSLAQIKAGKANIWTTWANRGKTH